MKYVCKHKNGEEWPTCFHDVDSGKAKLPRTYPVPQPHPSTKEYVADWDHQIQPAGPVGLLTASIAWNGLAVDKDFKIWQVKEEAISILNMPYQDLKKQIHMAGTRARARAEWNRETTTIMEELIEIDRKTSTIAPGLDDEEKRNHPKHPMWRNHGEAAHRHVQQCL